MNGEEPSRLRALVRALWLLPIAPAVGQLALLAYAVVSRVAYPYDLEWMEGGLLGHAARLSAHQGIYVEPTLDFIPYLYTPLYPALIALVSGMFGISYAIGRIISVCSLVALLGFAVTAVVRERGARRGPAWAGAALACGLIAATYPWVEGWFDLVRADGLFVAMIIGGLLGVRAWARVPGQPGRRRIGTAAAVLALSFFCKQTGIFYVAAGGAALLVLDWRRLPLYCAVAGAIGLGGTWLFDRASGGWFWTYVFEIHQAHDFSRDRFAESFGHILLQFPAMTAAIAVGLLAVAAAARGTRRRPPGSGALLYWTPMFVLSVVVGAIGWGTEFAHFNAFIPAMVTGAIAAGAAVPAVAGAAAALPRHGGWAGPAAGMVVGLALAAQLVHAWWQPDRFIPSERDRKAGDALVEHLRAVQGEVFMPYHPWYPVMAGKPLFTHRMGLIDVSQGKRMTHEQRDQWRARGVREAFRDQRFAEVILDNRPVGPELAGLSEAYRMDDFLPAELSPHVYSGAGVVPRSVWVPARPLPVPPGAHVLFDFESGRLDGWRATGRAWGKHPASGPVGTQGAVRRYGGRYFATSYHGADDETGTLVSPSFALHGSRITLRISGGRSPATLRAELWVDGRREKVATGNRSERMEEVMWNVASHSGKTGQIVLVDEETGSWGHLNVDEIWIWD
ncbi:MAG TPA: hypothetical protein VKB80_35875 [Kofleriaceae bacterium]|nr:hypothetical protein [Kofleriaceae bacterium]